MSDRYRGQLVDERNRAIATFSGDRPGFMSGVYARWNGRAGNYPDTRASGWMEWDETGRLVAYS